MTAPEPKQQLVLCTIAKMVYPDRLRDHPQDAQTYLALSQYVRRIYIVAASRDRRAHVSHVGRVVLVCLPQDRGRLLDCLRFDVAALRLGWRLFRKRGVSAFAASEPVVAGPVALVLKWLTGRPLVVHLLGELLDVPVSDWPTWRVEVTKRVTLFVAEHADRVRCVSHSVLESARRVGIHAERLVYLPMRVDTAVFAPEVQQAAGLAVRRRFGLGSGPIILFLGTLSIHKGVTHVVRAMARVAQECPEARLVLVGSGPLEIELRRLVAELGLGEHVLFAGRAHYEEVPAFLAAGDVLVLPSLNEGLPRVILEAMAMARPVVASRVGGVPELVQDGETGLLTAPRDEAALAESLLRLAKDPSLREAMGNRARQSIGIEYELEHNIARYAAELLTDPAACVVDGGPAPREREA